MVVTVCIVVLLFGAMAAIAGAGPTDPPTKEDPAAVIVLSSSSGSAEPLFRGKDGYFALVGDNIYPWMLGNYCDNEVNAIPLTGKITKQRNGGYVAREPGEVLFYGVAFGVRGDHGYTQHSANSALLVIQKRMIGLNISRSPIIYINKFSAKYEVDVQITNLDRRDPLTNLRVVPLICRVLKDPTSDLAVFNVTANESFAVGSCSLVTGNTFGDPSLATGIANLGTLGPRQKVSVKVVVMLENGV